MIQHQSSRFPVVVITGPVGVGKTTTAEALGELLIERNIPHTVIDMDALTWTYPRPHGDRFGSRLGFRNLVDVVRNAREAGSDRLIVAGVVESRDGRERYSEGIPGAEVTIVRLVAPIGSIHERIASRSAAGARNEAGIDWERNRAAELIAIMDAADAADMLIDTTGGTPNEIAAEIGVRLGWILGGETGS